MHHNIKSSTRGVQMGSTIACVAGCEQHGEAHVRPCRPEYDLICLSIDVNASLARWGPVKRLVHVEKCAAIRAPRVRALQFQVVYTSKSIQRTIPTAVPAM